MKNTSNKEEEGKVRGSAALMIDETLLFRNLVSCQKEGETREMRKIMSDNEARRFHRLLSIKLFFFFEHLFEFLWLWVIIFAHLLRLSGLY